MASPAGKTSEQKLQMFAKPGAGNLSILEQVLIQSATSTTSDIFVVGWTWIDRFDYQNVTDQSTTTRWEWEHKESGPITNWTTLLPSDTSKISQTYFKQLNSEYRDKLTSLIYIKTAIDTLNQKNIPFIMSYTDDLLFDKQWHLTPAVAELQSYIKPYMIDFEGQTFLEWSRTNEFAISPNLHPLEQAHRVAADHIITIFDKQKTNDPVQQVLV